MTSGQYVAWKWGTGLAEGKILSVHPEPTSIKSKGKLIKRNGSHDNPALIIEQSSGTRVLKLESEVKRLRSKVP
jgi:hypothetical protein